MAGVSTPNWGMPITGTPIGLPGPAHIPLGHPAGLQQHTIYNHTQMTIPSPTERLRYDVRQKPGQSYPAPAGRVWVNEENVHPAPRMYQPYCDQNQYVP